MRYANGWNLSKAPAPKRPPMAIRQTADLCAQAFRLGALSDWRYGQRTDTDKTLVWTVDGVEYAKTDQASVQAYVRHALETVGVVAVEYGSSWVGYPSIVVRYANGARMVERFDGVRVVVEAVAA